MLWGNNMAEMHPVLFSRILEHKRRNPGVRIVDIATRRTPTSQYADSYVEFKPGTDLALANGILHLIVKKGQGRRIGFLRRRERRLQARHRGRGRDRLRRRGRDNAERYTFKDEGRDSSLEELEAFLADYTPEKVSEITGVPVRRQIEIARRDVRRSVGAARSACGAWA